jgi:hypothetical protein
MNQVFGSIPPDLANCSRLSYLSLDRNNRMGEIGWEQEEGEKEEEEAAQTGTGN